tara:strand:- start:12141 stop:12389 length:249 start_codon:yes stop_codon:yes gene_type:complete
MAERRPKGPLQHALNQLPPRTLLAVINPEGSNMPDTSDMTKDELDLWSDINNPNNEADMEDWSDAHNPNNDAYLGDKTEEGS